MLTVASIDGGSDTDLCTRKPTELPVRDGVSVDLEKAAKALYGFSIMFICTH